MVDKQQLLKDVKWDARASGYHPCPDPELLDDLIDGLAQNHERYGYGACPCRIASGLKTYDSDIICPCEYRDADVAEYGMCYCGLYVSDAIADDPAKLQPIPERRPTEAQDAAEEARERAETATEAKTGTDTEPVVSSTAVSIPIWRCTVCGYLCARELPPPVCPICKAKADRFERFDITPA